MYNVTLKIKDIFPWVLVDSSWVEDKIYYYNVPFTLIGLKIMCLLESNSWWYFLDFKKNI